MEVLGTLIAALRTESDDREERGVKFSPALRLSSCQLTAQNLVSILDMIARNTKLTSVALDISGNEIGSSGALQLATALSGRTQLSALSLAEMKIKAKGKIRNNLSSLINCYSVIDS